MSYSSYSLSSEMQNKSKVEIKEFNNGCLRSTLLLMMLLLYSRLTTSRLVNVLVVSRLALAYVGRRKNSTMLPRRFNHSSNESWISLANERLMALQISIIIQDVVQPLLAQLPKAEPRRSVLSIYGMGGLGKTTIARNLYNSPDILNSFPTRVWICVSQEYNTMDLLRNIIKSIQGRTKVTLDLLERMTEGDLKIYLRDLLKERKYFVVVDDVWKKEAWGSLKRAFPDSKNGSRVIITTRKEDVTERADDRGNYLMFEQWFQKWNV
ncbi:hypothetical protein KY285_019589 [Solanum tuberosum]|nr:hypothetical protein KY285_019589 [Solanum tuberosum]